MGIIIFYFIFLKEKFNNKQISFLLISILIITPIPPLIFTGLEHILHIIVSILFIYFASELSTNKYSFRYNLIYVILSISLPLLRYEGLVLVGAASIILMINKKWLLSIVSVSLSMYGCFYFWNYFYLKRVVIFPEYIAFKRRIPGPGYNPRLF